MKIRYRVFCSQRGSQLDVREAFSRNEEDRLGALVPADHVHLVPRFRPSREVASDGLSPAQLRAIADLLETGNTQHYDAPDSTREKPLRVSY